MHFRGKFCYCLFFFVRAMCKTGGFLFFFWVQETVSSLEEPVGIVFSEESRKSASKSTETEPDSQGALSSFARQLFVELPLRQGKSRVLSEAMAADGARSKGEDLIEQVTSKEGEDDGSTTVSVDLQQTTTASQQKFASEVDSLLLSSFCVHHTKFS